MFWDLVADYHLDIYLDRVSTDANPSDGLSRGRVREAEGWGGCIEPARFPEDLNKARNKA